MSSEKTFQVLLSPYISEKVARIQASNQYVFKVAKTATKAEIKEAVESLFDVKVANVNVVNVKGKTKRFRFRVGKRADEKKAYIRLEDGQTIDVLSQP